MQLAGPHSMLEIDEAGQVSARTRKQLRLISPLPYLPSSRRSPANRRRQNGP